MIKIGNEALLFETVEKIKKDMEVNAKLYGSIVIVEDGELSTAYRLRGSTAHKKITDLRVYADFFTYNETLLSDDKRITTTSYYMTIFDGSTHIC